MIDETGAKISISVGMTFPRWRHSLAARPKMHWNEKEFRSQLKFPRVSFFID